MSKEKLQQTAAQLEAIKAAKRVKFVKVGQARVATAIKKIRLIGNLARPSSYAFTPKDVQDLKLALAGEVIQVVDRFNSALEGKTQKAETTFVFGSQVASASDKK